MKTLINTVARAAAVGVVAFTMNFTSAGAFDMDAALPLPECKDVKGKECTTEGAETACWGGRSNTIRCVYCTKGDDGKLKTGEPKECTRPDKPKGKMADVEELLGL